MSKSKDTVDLLPCLEVAEPTFAASPGMEAATKAAAPFGFMLPWPLIVAVLKDIANKYAMPWIAENIPALIEKVENSNLPKFVRKVLVKALQYLADNPPVFAAVSGS